MKIICVGDSLTAGEIGFCYRDYLDSNIEAINKGMNGDNTFGVLARLRRYLRNDNYKDVDNYLIFTGLNDLLLFDFSTIKDLISSDEETFKSNYENIAKELKDKKKKGVFVSISFVESLDTTHKSIKRFNEIIKEIADKNGFIYCDIYSPMKEFYLNGEELTIDGSHFKEISARVSAREIEKAINKL